MEPRCEAKTNRANFSGVEMSSITPHYRTVENLLQSRSFSIDEYQREYKWGKNHIEELLTDLQSKFLAEYQPGDTPKKASEYGEYFLGSIIVSRRGVKSYLVDGQQRVTSLTLLLIYLYRVATEKGWPVASTISPLIFADNYGEQRFNLDIAERVPVLRALFNGEEYNPEGKDESVRNMYVRYKDIEEFSLADELGEGLQTFTYWLMNNVGLIEIATETDSHAYAIFETMNDRGKPLSPVDMLKAYLLAPVVAEDERVRANKLWRQAVQELNSWGDEPEPERDAVFIKSWLRAQYATSIRERRVGAVDKDWEQIGTTFHRWFREVSPRIGAVSAGENVRIMTEEVPFFARAYRTILGASRDYLPGLEPIFYNAHNDFTWQPTVLLALLCPSDDDAIVQRKMAAVATYLDIWLMRRVVNYVRVGYSSVSYAMFTLVRDIRRLALPDLIDTLRQKLDEDAVDISFRGSSSRGRYGVADLGINKFSGRYVYHLLARVTAYVEVQSGRPDLFDKYVDRSQKNPLDIEHIWADKFEQYNDECDSVEDFARWRNNVAGLLLLPADVNRSYQDKSYALKAPHYAKQNLWAASLTPSAYEHQPQFVRFAEVSGLNFRPYEKYGKKEQSERRELLLAVAELIWSPERLEQYR